MAEPCFECGQSAGHRHHVVPKSRGGTKTIPLCESCHGKAHSRSMTTKQLTREALQRRKKNGHRVGTVPFGYFLSHDGRTLIEDAGQQFWLREMRQMRANGKTLREIAERLQLAGVKTAKGRDRWQEKTIRQLCLSD